MHTGAEAKRRICTRLLLLPTSLVILAIRAERFRRYIASQPSPSWLADAVPDVLIEDAPPVVVAQPGAAVCQHIMCVSNSRARKNKDIRWRRERNKIAKGAFRVDRVGAKMIKDSLEWTHSTIHLWQDWGCVEGREVWLSFHMSHRSLCSHTEEGSVWEKRGKAAKLFALLLKGAVGGTVNAGCITEWLNWEFEVT